MREKTERDGVSIFCVCGSFLLLLNYKSLKNLMEPMDPLFYKKKIIHTCTWYTFVMDTLGTNYQKALDTSLAHQSPVWNFCALYPEVQISLSIVAETMMLLADLFPKPA